MRLRAGLPLNILVVDLGGGLTPTAPKKVVELEHVKSAPFQALLHGMTDPGVRWLGGVGVSLSGFATIMAAMSAAPSHGVIVHVKASRSRQWPSGANKDATAARFPFCRAASSCPSQCSTSSRSDRVAVFPITS